MKVLLCQDIRKLGWLGDVVEVNDGYARNYLLPQGLAQPATEPNIRAIADEKAKRADARKLETERLAEVASAVEGAEAVLAAKANEQGGLFGSVGEAEISANLREQGFEVAAEYVDLPQHIKQVGTHTVKLDFGDGLGATVSVVVVPEGADVAAIEAIKEAAGKEDTSAAEQKKEEHTEKEQEKEQEQGEQ
jgi:large subunit ribosomal protein L9